MLITEYGHIFRYVRIRALMSLIFALFINLTIWRWVAVGKVVAIHYLTLHTGNLHQVEKQWGHFLVLVTQRSDLPVCRHRTPQRLTRMSFTLLSFLGCQQLQGLFPANPIYSVVEYSATSSANYVFTVSSLSEPQPLLLKKAKLNKHILVLFCLKA